MTWQELTSPYLNSTTSQQCIKHCRVLPAPQVTVPVTEVWIRIFPIQEGVKFSQEDEVPKAVLGNDREAAVPIVVR